MLWILFGLNASVAVLSYFVYGYELEPVILCLLYCFMNSKVCDMTNVTRSDSKYGYHDKPTDYASNYSTWVVSSNYLRNDADWWFIARALTSNSAIKNRDGNKWGGAITNSSYKKTTTHIYAGTLPESVTLDSKDVMVRATAPTGQVYEVTTFTRFSSFDGLAWERY